MRIEIINKIQTECHLLPHQMDRRLKGKTAFKMNEYPIVAKYLKRTVEQLFHSF